jgi:hypothetical protein
MLLPVPEDDEIKKASSECDDKPWGEGFRFPLAH